MTGLISFVIRTLNQWISPDPGAKHVQSAENSLYQNIWHIYAMLLEQGKSFIRVYDIGLWQRTDRFWSDNLPDEHLNWPSVKEGNDFTGMCLSTRGEVTSHTSWDISHGREYPLWTGHTHPTHSGIPPWTYPPPCTYPPSLDILTPASDIRWSSLENCSGLFTWGPTSSPTVLTCSGGHRIGIPTGMLSC